MKKRYTKDGKIHTAPLVIVQEDGSTIHTNDEAVILSAGYAEYEEPVVKPSLESLIRQSDDEINRETDRKILKGFTWKGSYFYLTAENQRNFANMYIAKDMLEYPVIIKTQTGFRQLADAEAVTDFYLCGIAYIRQCLEDGWRRKAEEAEKITTEYGEEA